INASIIMQLMTVAIPQLQELQKEGDSGLKQINKITRYLTVVLAILQSIGYYQLLSSQGALEKAAATFVIVVSTLTAGTMFLMWLGEQMTEKGIGNGISLLIFVGIMVSLPSQFVQTFQLVAGDPTKIIGVVATLLLFLATIVGVIYMTQGVRKIPVHHMKRIVGTRMSQAGTSFLPFKVNTAGVMPIIFAMSIQLFPATIAQFFPNVLWVKQATDWLQPGASIWASLVFAVLILFFTYFFVAMQYDTHDIADNLKKHGSLIPGVRPGKPTAVYLDKVLTRITLAGAVFLAAVSLIQYWAPTWTGITTFSLVGGTSLLIVVGVALETMTAIEAQMAMRNYEGFIRTPSGPAGSGAAQTGGGTKSYGAARKAA
ncbi:MAG: preprotein translocase subunit SecY, partial [Armatimonadetes bacterium]|nr:preprotein translocase subunit SecY [Armatimonadota bacterium]